MGLGFTRFVETPNRVASRMIADVSCGTRVEEESARFAGGFTSMSGGERSAVCDIFLPEDLNGSAAEYSHTHHSNPIRPRSEQQSKKECDSCGTGEIKKECPHWQVRALRFEPSIGGCLTSGTGDHGWDHTGRESLYKIHRRAARREFGTL